MNEVRDFDSVQPIWNSLVEKTRFSNNVFLTYDWLSIWWKHFGGQRKLFLLTAEENDEVIGIAPLMFSKYKFPALGTIRKIEFVGTRHSDYNDFIVSRSESYVLSQFMNYISNREKWDWIELKEIPENNNLKDLLTDVSSNFDLKQRVCNLCPYVALPKKFDTLRRTFGKNLRQNLNRYVRKISHNHNLELKRYDEAGFSPKEAMNLLIKMHNQKWRSEGKPGAFADENFRDFHRDVAECMAQKDWLAIYFLTLDGEPIASQYNFEYSGKMYYYLAGFLPEYADFSVGNLLIMFLLKRCIERGFTEYDMTRGDERYKMQWTSRTRKNYEVRLVRKKLTSELYNWITWGPAVEGIATRLGISMKKSS